MKFTIKIVSLIFVLGQLTACSAGDFFPHLKSSGSAPSAVSPLDSDTDDDVNDDNNAQNEETGDNQTTDPDPFAPAEGADFLVFGERVALPFLVLQPIPANLVAVSESINEVQPNLDDQGDKEDNEDGIEFSPVKLAFYDDGTGRFLNEDDETLYDFNHQMSLSESIDLAKVCNDGLGEVKLLEGLSGFDEETNISTQIIDVEGECDYDQRIRRLNVRIENEVEQDEEELEEPAFERTVASCFAVQFTEENPPYCYQGEDVCTPQADTCVPQPDLCTPQADLCTPGPIECTTIPGANGRDTQICVPTAEVCTPQPDICVPQIDICTPNEPICTPGAIICEPTRPNIETFLFEKKENGCDDIQKLQEFHYLGHPYQDLD